MRLFIAEKPSVAKALAAELGVTKKEKVTLNVVRIKSPGALATCLN